MKRASVGAAFHGPGGQVDHRRVRVLHHEPIHQHGHAGRRHPGPFVQDEGVPERQERPGQCCDHDGVVNVGDDAKLCVRGDDKMLASTGSVSARRQYGGVPARGEGHRNAVSTSPPRSAMTFVADAADLDLHFGTGIGTLVKARQPRTFCVPFRAA